MITLWRLKKGNTNHQPVVEHFPKKNPACQQGCHYEAISSAEFGAADDNHDQASAKGEATHVHHWGWHCFWQRIASGERQQTLGANRRVATRPSCPGERLYTTPSGLF